MTSSVQRTLKALRDTGYTAAVVERWNPHAKIRQDLFGLIDVLALPPAVASVQRVLGVQVCGAGGDAAKHVRKALASKDLDAVLQCCQFEIWAWRKVGPRGKRKTWQRRTLTFGLDPYRDVVIFDSETSAWTPNTDWLVEKPSEPARDAT